MAIALSDLLKDLKPEDLLEDFIAVAKVLGLSTTAWQPGEPIRAFVSIFCRWLVAPWNKQVLPALRAFFLDHAEGDWLTLIAWVLYGVHRKGETFASGKIIVENQEGGFWAISPGDVRFENADGKTFRNVDGGTLASWGGSGPYPELELTFTADETGSASTTPAGTVPTIPLEAPGAGIFLQTNTVAFVGQDEESDGALKDRCRDSAGPLSPAGPAAAYRYVALSTRRPDGIDPDRLLVSQDGDVACNVNRALVENAGGGVINVKLASPSGAATGDLSTVDSDVYLVNQAIQLLVVPLGITANVGPADDNAQSITITLYVRRDANVTIADAQANGKAAVDKWFETFPIGGRKRDGDPLRYLVMEEVRRVASDAVPGTIYATSTPSSDVAIDLYDVVAPTVTVTAVLVTQ